MLQEVRATINKYLMFSPGDSVLVGVSGGPDSVALLHVLHELSQELQISVAVAHLNHSFRGQESAGDADFVRDLATKLKLRAAIHSEDVASFATRQGLSVQTAAREVRYRFFGEAANRLKCNKLATGHTANDQAETVLLNFLRGSGAGGLGGIPPVREGWIVRPLIESSRAQVEEYCQANGLITRLDKSNLKGVYTRNRIRLELIPRLKEEYNPNLIETLARTSEIMRDNEAVLEEITDTAWNKLCVHERDDGLTFNLPVFLNLPTALRRRIIRRAWAKTAGSVLDLEFAHMSSILNILEKGQAGSMLNLPHGVILKKSYDQFCFCRETCSVEDLCYEYELAVPGITVIPELGQAICSEVVDRAVEDNHNNHKPDSIIVDFNKVSLPLKVRNRLPGDRFWPSGMEGSQKLKKHLIDKKIPREVRANIPVLVTGDEQVVWLVGLRADRRWQTDPTTQKALRLKIIENIY